MSESPAARAQQRLLHVCERLTPSDGPRWDLAFDLASAVVGAVVLLLVAMTFGDYGITWDETWHLTYGRHVIHWYVSLFADENALTYRADYLYGGSFDALGYLARQISPLDRYATIHLFGALIGCLGLLGAWKFARLLGGAAAGFAGLVLLVLTPVWYGHMFNNPKDMPFAVGYVWALYYEVRILIAMPAVPRREWVKASIALGAAMSVRIAGLLTLCYLWMLVGLWVLWHARHIRRDRPNRVDLELVLRYLVRFSPKLLATSLGAWALMLVFWPWAQLDPIRRPLIALARMSAFNLHERGMPFGNRRISTLSPPPDYMLRYFGFKLTELVLILVVAALVVFIIRAVRLRKRNRAERLGLSLPNLAARGLIPAFGSDESRRVAVGAFLLFSIAFPWIYAILKRSPLYDGERHFLFLVPIFVVIAGVSLTHVIRVLAARSRIAAWGAYIVTVAYCVRMVLAMIHVHPHEYLWFNKFIGGLPGAFLKYDTDYYGNTYKEGFETLREYLWENERERYLAGPYVVSACMPDFIAQEYLGTNFEQSKGGGGRPEFWLGYTRNDCYLKHGDAPELTRVEREDTLLVLIRDLRNPEQDALDAKAKARAAAAAKAKAAKAKAKQKPKPKPKPTVRPKPSTTKRPKTDPTAPIGAPTDAPTIPKERP
jgi:hypothetical protein